MSRYDKLFISLRYYLLGKEYFTALKALDFAKQNNSGLRKDGVTPSFQHQIEIALYVSTLKNLQNEHLCLTAALLHDDQENESISTEEIKKRFGDDVSEVVWLLTKKFKGTAKTAEEYFGKISENPVASIVKGADRIHNIQSMVGVFSKEKQKSYIKEVEEKFLPMIKIAKYKFPEQSAAYFNIEHMLKSQIALIKAGLEK